MDLSRPKPRTVAEYMTRALSRLSAEALVPRVRRFLDRDLMLLANLVTDSGPEISERVRATLCEHEQARFDQLLKREPNTVQGMNKREGLSEFLFNLVLTDEDLAHMTYYP